jgi:hypothetical protein
MKIRFPDYPAVHDPGSEWLEITIPEGNYSTIPGEQSSLLYVVQTLIRNAYLPFQTSGALPVDPTITLTLNTSTGHVSFTSASSGVKFALDFRGSPYDHRTYDWGLGYNLGFSQKAYLTPDTFFTGSAIIDIIGAAYVFFQLDNIEPIQHYTPEKNVISAFAKLIMTGDKNSIVYDDGSSFITKEYRFQQPTDFFLIHPRIVDTYGDLVDLNGKNYSFTLELEEVTNLGAYKQFRDNALSKPSDWIATYNA